MIWSKLLIMTYLYMLMTPVYQHKDVKEIERNLNKDFWDVCDLFVDNKLIIHFGEDKTNTISDVSRRIFLGPKKWNIPLFTLLFLNLSKVFFKWENILSPL